MVTDDDNTEVDTLTLRRMGYSMPVGNPDYFGEALEEIPEVDTLTLRRMGYSMPVGNPDYFGEALEEILANHKIKRSTLAGRLNVTPTYIGQLIRKKTPPSTERLLQIVDALELKGVERRYLLTMTTPAAYEVTRESIYITPEEEAERQSMLGEEGEPSVIWVVADRILDLDVVYPTTLRNIATKEHVKYVYFQSRKYTFWKLYKQLHNSLTTDYPDINPDKRLNSSLECIIAPPTLFASSFVIENPGELDMTGRVSLHEKGEIKYVFGMDGEKVQDVYKTLSPIYRELKQVGEYEGEEGLFRLVFPRR